MSPMCQYSAATEGPDTGAPTDWHFSHLTTRATGGAGLIFVEATAVSPEGRISPADLGLWNERQQQAYVRIAEFLKRRGTVPGIQLAHAGRKASTDAPWRGGKALTPEQGGWRPVGPSPIAYDDKHPVPHELTAEETAGIVSDFAAAAERALAAGFQVVEIHGADRLDVSSGGNAAGVRIPLSPGYQVPLATAVKQQTDLPVAAVGLITEPAQAEAIVAHGEADAVLLGRELLRSPYWPRLAARELGVASAWPEQYRRAV